LACLGFRISFEPRWSLLATEPNSLVEI
jgi:hypothetical protein